MATLVENREMQMTNATQEAQKHNAHIRERYQRLQNAEATQFAQSVAEKEVARVAAPVAEEPVFVPVFTQPVATVEQAPQITEFVSARRESPVFTTEKLDRALENSAVRQEMAPTLVKPVYAPTPVATVSVAAEAQFTLSAAAKVVLAVFVAVVVAMLTLICVNSQIIQQKSIKIRNLEEKKEELMNQSEELQRRIDAAQSRETIEEYAKSQGMIRVGE